MFITDLIFASALGSASGLRVSSVPLAAGLGAHTPFFALPEEMIWMASPDMLGIWFLLNFVEFGAFSIPGVASLLDLATLGLAPLGSAYMVTLLSPDLGMGTALAMTAAPSAGVQLATSGVRAVSGPFAGVVSAFETLVGAIAAILAVLLPILALAFVAWLVFWGVKRAKRFVKARRERRSGPPPAAPEVANAG